MKLSRSLNWKVPVIIAGLCLAVFFGWKVLDYMAKRKADSDRIAVRRKAMRHTILSLADYEAQYGTLPVAASQSDSGLQLSSWRLAVIPFSPFESQVDTSLPWNDGMNLQLTERPVFFCFRNKGSLETSVFAVTGLGTAFDPNRRMVWEDLPDDTILLIEVANSGVPWGAPGDLEIDEVHDKLPALLDDKGFYVAFADLSVWHLDASLPIDTLRPFFLLEGARSQDRYKVLAPYRIGS